VFLGAETRGWTCQPSSSLSRHQELGLHFFGMGKKGGVMRKRRGKE
jgi:hypothetical protein